MRTRKCGNGEDISTLLDIPNCPGCYDLGSRPLSRMILLPCGLGELHFAPTEKNLIKSWAKFEAWGWRVERGTGERVGSMGMVSHIYNSSTMEVQFER